MPTATRPQPTQTNGRVEPDHARDETDRYRQAAQDALQQLDWCIGYLHGIRKSRISAQLAKNRAYIKRELLREPTPPLPTEVTNET
jgi:hypothetical protein